jgi:exodeoxyribonuclease VII small subunit
MSARERPEDAGAAGQEPGFEQGLERLEKIVEELEGGALTLEQTIARYEEGLALSRRLTQTLEEAERRIEELTENARGEPQTRPMAGEPGDEDSPRRMPRRSRRRTEEDPPEGGPDELPF